MNATNIAIRDWLWISLLLMAAGCSGGAKDGLVATKGTITFNGSPLQQGTVVFESADGGNVLSHAGKIHDGSFTVECTPGKKVVRVTSTQLAEPTDLPASMRNAIETGPGSLVPIQIIPPQYNRKSTLTIDVPSDPGSPLALDLKD